MSETAQDPAGKDPGEGIVRAKTADSALPSALAREARNAGNAQRLRDLQQGTTEDECSGRLDGESLGASMKRRTETGRTVDQKAEEMQARERARVIARDQRWAREDALKRAKARIDLEQKRDGERRREWHRMVGVHREFARDYAKYRAGALC